MIDGVNHYEVYSDYSQNEVTQNFIHIIEDLYQQVTVEEKCITHIALAFPGPFDYENGVSLMKGLEKYDSLYQFNVKEALEKGVRKSKIRSNPKLYIKFFNDANSFAFGEYQIQPPTNKKGLYITLGTGCGSTFLEENQIIQNRDSIPSSGMIYNEPFKEGIIDDYLSSRGLMKIIEKVYGRSLKPEDVFCLANNKEKKALETFRIFGQDIAKALLLYVREFDPSEIVFGGQVSKSFVYMEESIQERLQKNNLTPNLRVSQNTSLATIRGLNVLEKRGEEND